MDFIAAFSSTVIQEGAQNTFGLAVRRINHIVGLYEFEIPDLAATVSVKDPKWLPADNAIHTSWGITESAGDGTSPILTLSECLRTRSGVHHKVGSKCTRTRSGKHYPTPPTRTYGPESELERELIYLNVKPVSVGTDAFTTITLARQAIQAPRNFILESL